MHTTQGDSTDDVCIYKNAIITSIKTTGDVYIYKM